MPVCRPVSNQVAQLQDRRPLRERSAAPLPLPIPRPLVPELLAVRAIRSFHNPHQLAGIQPVQEASRAIVDHHIAGAAVKVRVHVLVALRAFDPAVQFPAVGRVRHAVAGVAGLQLLNQRQEIAHRHQHAATVRAGTDALPAEGGVHQRNRADGARRALRFAQQAYAFVILLGQVNGLAIIAGQALLVAFQAQRSAARRAVHGCGLPQPGQNLARFGMAPPQSMQNLESAAAAAAGSAAGALRAPIMLCAMARPAPSPTPAPAAPPGLAAAMGIDCAAWNCAYRAGSPAMFIPMRWSSTFCNSSGSDRFSTTNWQSSRPRPPNAGFNSAAIFSASLAWFAAISTKATSLGAKISVIFATIVLRSCPSRSET